jgi:prepilin-type N-terminal cleavage/methylation domain-containing protein
MPRSRRQASTQAKNSRAFSLVEMVIVVVIIGILAGIAIPRISHAVTAARANALLETMAAVRTAIDHYYAEHGHYPGYDPGDGTPDDDMFIKQLTEYSDQNGNVSESPSAVFLYGPYLQLPFPTNPFNELSNVKVRAKHSTVSVLSTSGWIAYLDDGSFEINASAEEIAKLEVASGDLAEKLTAPK